VREAREKGLTPELVYEKSRSEAKPILDKCEIWLKEIAPNTPPKVYWRKHWLKH
jgi:hypothetical protein